MVSNSPPNHNKELLSLSLIELIKRYNPIASKRLGQNFLIDDNTARKIVYYAGNLRNKTVVEIGPGIGALTRLLLQTDAKELIAVEYDRNFIPVLDELSALFPGKMRILNADALQIKEEELTEGQKITLVSNLPYNISIILLLKWLKKINLFERLVLMFQKEVAERLLAERNTKSYGVTTVLTQYLCDVSLAFDIGPKVFSPEPNVDSAVVVITPKKNVDELMLLYPKLREVCNTLFNHRRKMIRNTLKTLTTDVEELCNKSALNPTLRPEDLSIEDFTRLAIAVS